MLRPAPLDRVENGRSGSDINPRRRGLERSEYASMAERRPTLTASARSGVRNLRSGRKKACGAVEQKKAAKQGRKKSGKKALAFVAAIRERRNGFQVEQRN